jgi:hypothetical protein
LTNKEKNPAGKFRRLKDGSWKSRNNRWRIVRSATGRYDLHDLNRAKDDTLYMMGMPTVVACEEGARGVEWADRVEKDPSGQTPE